VIGHGNRRRALRAASFVALAALAAGVGVAVMQWRRPIEAPASGREIDPAPAATADVDEAAIEQALRQQPVTNGDDRHRWVSVVPGIDVSGLTARQREVFVRFANAERCTCGCGYSLAGCRAYDPSCEVSGPIVLALRDSVARGLVADASHLRRPPPARAVDR
jgi:hypothetical protein